jgi:hypothetical protein
MSEITYTERGFAEFGEEIDTAYGAKVNFSESSAASGPHLWMSVDGDVHLREDPRSVVGIPFGIAKAHAGVHLNLKQARKIHDQLGQGIKFMEERDRDWVG